MVGQENDISIARKFLGKNVVKVTIMDGTVTPYDWYQLVFTTLKYLCKFSVSYRFSSQLFEQLEMISDMVSTKKT